MSRDAFSPKSQLDVLIRVVAGRPVQAADVAIGDAVAATHRPEGLIAELMATCEQRTGGLSGIAEAIISRNRTPDLDSR